MIKGIVILWTIYLRLLLICWCWRIRLWHDGVQRRLCSRGWAGHGWYLHSLGDNCNASISYWVTLQEKLTTLSLLSLSCRFELKVLEEGGYLPRTLYLPLFGFSVTSQ